MKKLVALFFITGVAAVYLYLLWQKQSVSVVQPSVKQQVSSSFSSDDAPSDSLRGTVASMSGDVKWTARTATEAAVLQPNTLLKQGESIETGATGEATLDLSGKAEARLSPESTLALVQTLPQNIVYQQTRGTVSYLVSDVPVSVRIMHSATLLTGEMMVSIDEETARITFQILKGSARIGFNDLDYQSITATLSEGKTYRYDDAKREITRETIAP